MSETGDGSGAAVHAPAVHARRGRGGGSRGTRGPACGAGDGRIARAQGGCAGRRDGRADGGARAGGAGLQGRRLRARRAGRQGTLHRRAAERQGPPQAAAGRARLPLLPRLLPPHPRLDATHARRQERERRLRQPGGHQRGPLGAVGRARRRAAVRDRPRPGRGHHAAGPAGAPGRGDREDEDVPAARGQLPGGPAGGVPDQLRGAPLRPVGARRRGGTTSARPAGRRSTRRSPRAG